MLTILTFGVIAIGAYVVMEGGAYVMWGTILVAVGSMLLGYFLGYSTAETAFLRKQNKKLEESLKFKRGEV